MMYFAGSAQQTRVVAEVKRRMSVVGGVELLVSGALKHSTRLRQSILQRASAGG
jgi:hypothetical protein